MTPPRQEHGESRIHLEGLKPADVALLKDVAEEAADKAVIKMLATMGMDPTKPFDAQKDMMFLRSTRERCEKGAWQAAVVLIGLVVAGAAAWLWTGFKASLK